MLRYGLIIMLLAALIGLSSCGKHDPIQANGANGGRNGQLYGAAQRIFGNDAGNPTYYDTDMSPIMKGPGLTLADKGYPWSNGGYTWSVAVAITDGTVASNATIVYRFLGVPSSGIPVISPVLNMATNGCMRFARVASCYFQFGPPDDAYHNFVEVTCVWQEWDTNTLKWRIGIGRVGFDSGLIRREHCRSLIGPAWWGQDLPELPTQVEDNMMPDVADNPTNPNLNDLAWARMVITYVDFDDLSGGALVMYCDRTLLTDRL